MRERIIHQGSRANGEQVPLWIMADLAPADYVFTSFQNDYGWSSMGLAVMAGTIGIGAFSGSEAGVHMSEEVRNAAYVIPRSMMWSWLGNGLMGFVMIITFCFCVADTQKVLESPLTAIGGESAMSL